MLDADPELLTGSERKLRQDWHACLTQYIVFRQTQPELLQKQRFAAWLRQHPQREHSENGYAELHPEKASFTATSHFCPLPGGFDPLPQRCTQSVPAGVQPLAAAEHFDGKPYLHPKAVALPEDKASRNVDIRLICDALDFLATDYWDHRYKQTSKEEMPNRCSRKHGRPFEISPIGPLPHHLRAVSIK
jgi:hypothetical protein